MLKKLTAAGFLAATATGAMLLGGPANADLLTAHQAAAPTKVCYNGQVYYQPAWCTPSAPTIGVYPGVPSYPGYGYGGGWHHRHYWPGRVYFRR